MHSLRVQPGFYHGSTTVLYGLFQVLKQFYCSIQGSTRSDDGFRLRV